MIAPRRLVVSMDEQNLKVLEGGRCIREYVVSTAANGMGFVKDSHCTPAGRFRICEKIGGGEPPGTIFRFRMPIGIWEPGSALEDDLILSRILRLDGLDEENINTLERCIYIHGTNREDLLGVPSSHGCIRLSNIDIIELFDMVTVDDLLEIIPVTGKRP